ncbi:hypothetical protein PM082_014752 [Marasmius tenuissimus]|nr:hypothetical protein PM082_014752 [Marasmius tenuissimus]
MLTGKPETDGLVFLDAYTSGADRQNSYPPGNVIATPRRPVNGVVSYQTCLDEVQRVIAEDEKNGQLPILLEHTHMLMTSATLNDHIFAPRTTRPSPVVADKMLDVPSESFEDGGWVFPGMFNNPQMQATKIPNPTLLPDRFFFGFTPVITIRHPALMIPSLIRGRQKLQGEPKLDCEFTPIATYRWEKMIFDCYRSCSLELGLKTVPVVIDGSKLVRDPKGTMGRLCDIIGVEEHEVVRYTWEPACQPARDAFWETFTGDLRRSSGIKPVPVPETIDLTKEKTKWIKEWGPELAEEIESWVNYSLKDYEYLFQYSI